MKKQEIKTSLETMKKMRIRDIKKIYAYHGLYYKDCYMKMLKNRNIKK